MSDLIPRHSAWLRAIGRSEHTVMCRQRRLRHADTHLPHGIDGSHTDEIEIYMGEPTWSRWTRHTYHNHLRAYYDWAHTAGHLTMNPMTSMPRPPEGDRLPDPCTDQELSDALAYLPMRPLGVAVRLAAWAGLRCCEIVALRREDCTTDALRVLGKGGLTRTVSMAPMLWEMIEPLPRGRVCVGARGRPIGAKTLSNMQQSQWQLIGQPEQHIHRMRHWFGTNLLKGGADLRTVQQLMGHRSIMSTVGYTQVVDAQRRAAVRRLPDVINHSNVDASTSDVISREHQPVGTRLVPPAA